MGKNVVENCKLGHLIREKSIIMIFYVKGHFFSLLKKWVEEYKVPLSNDL